MNYPIAGELSQMAPHEREMNKRLTPQRKKELSLAKDRRNAYAQSLMMIQERRLMPSFYSS